MKMTGSHCLIGAIRIKMCRINCHLSIVNYQLTKHPSLRATLFKKEGKPQREFVIRFKAKLHRLYIMAKFNATFYEILLLWILFFSDTIYSIII